MTEISLIPIAAIVASDRLRPVDEAWAEALAESIRDHGLEQPIVVRVVRSAQDPLKNDDLTIRASPTGYVDHYELVAGAHRLAAIRRLGFDEIPAIVRDLTADEARIVEIDENVMRRELSELDKSVFLAERSAVWVRLYPETAHGGARKSRKKQGRNQVANLATWSCFSKDAAEKTGMSERSIQRYCRIAKELGPEAITALRATPLADNQAQLLLLTRMAPAEREAAITAAVAAKSTTVSAALRSVGLGRPARSADEETYRKLCELWDRAGAKVRKRFTARIGLGDDDTDETVAA